MSSWVKQWVVFQPARSRVRVGLLRDYARVGSGPSNSYAAFLAIRHRAEMNSLGGRLTGWEA
jgi:hypothetical protein